MPHGTPRCETRGKEKMMSYWFTPAGLAFLLLCVLFGGAAIMAQFTAPNPEAATFLYMAMGICGLVAGYNILRKRHAIGRFHRVFGFMPSDRYYEEWCRPFVEREIRDNASLLQDAYCQQDEKLEAMSRVTEAEAAAKATEAYRDARAHVRRCRTLYSRALTAASSKWLPAPYRGLPSKLNDWAPRRRQILI